MKNKYYLYPDDTTVIQVKRRDGKVYGCLIDTVDLPFIQSFGYSVGLTMKSNGPYFTMKIKGKNKYLHILLMDSPDGIVDHRDRDTTNNRRSNLRVVTQQINSMNSNKQIGKAGYKWVKVQKGNKYAARVVHRYKEHHLGNFVSALEAHRVSNRWVYENIGSEFCIRKSIIIKDLL